MKRNIIYRVKKGVVIGRNGLTRIDDVLYFVDSDSFN